MHSSLTAPAGQALAPSDAQHRTWSVTRHRVAEIVQATQHARLRTSSSDHQHIHSHSARGLGQHVSNRSDGNANPYVGNSGAVQLLDAPARFFFRRLQRSSKPNSIGRPEPFAGIIGTSVRSTCTAFAAWLANRVEFLDGETSKVLAIQIANAVSL